MRAFFHPSCATAALLLAVTLPASAADSPPVTPTTSVRTSQALLSRLPKFDAAKSDAAKKAAAEAAAQSARRTETEEKDGIVYLPDYEVVDHRTTAPREDEWLARKELAQRAVRRLEAKSTGLDLLLNRWHIPLLTPSFKARALADYEAERNAAENERLEHINKVWSSSGGKK